MTTVAIIGAHGKIGLLTSRELSRRGHRVLGVIRNPEHAEELREAGAEPVVLDIESAEPAALAEAIHGAEAVLFTAGAGGGSGAARKQTVDYGGSVLAVEAATLLGIRPFVQISFIGVDVEPQPSDDESWDAYHRAKKQADDHLRASQLDWIIVRPGGLTEEPADGRVRLGADLGKGSTSRETVARLVVALLEEPRARRVELDVLDGTGPDGTGPDGMAPLAEALAGFLR